MRFRPDAEGNAVAQSGPERSLHQLPPPLVSRALLRFELISELREAHQTHQEERLVLVVAAATAVQTFAPSMPTVEMAARPVGRLT